MIANPWLVTLKISQKILHIINTVTKMIVTAFVDFEEIEKVTCQDLIACGWKPFSQFIICTHLPRVRD